MIQTLSAPALSPTRTYSLVTLAFTYLVVRFGLTPQLDALGAYGAYIFEVVCVAIAVGLLGPRTFTQFRFVKPAAAGAILALGAGFSAFKAAGVMGIQVPFDLRGTETVIFLLAVAPTLEEAIFRFLLWQPIEILSRRPVIAMILTSVIFSYSHFHAYWFVSPQIHLFLFYQTAYTLVLGLACGFFVYRYNSLNSAMFIHFGFNFGFYLASLN